jgi:RNA polymerase sigma factor (sigma-70 family)
MSLELKDIEKLYQENKDYLFRFFMRATQNEDVAYDIVQSIFLNLVRYVQEKKIGSIQRSYLIQMGYNYYFNELEKRKRQENRELRYFDQNIQNFDVQSEIEEDNTDLFSLVQGVIVALEISDRMKQALFMRLFSEEKIGDIARVLGVSYRTSLRDLETGMKLLKEALIQKGIRLYD